jgi:hypothetical protein
MLNQSESLKVFSKLNDRTLALCIAILYFFYLAIFKIEIHTWESYVYADSISGLFDLAKQFNGLDPLLKKTLANYSGINFYHPNHPLLHFFSFQISSLLNYSVLAVVQFFNMLFGSLSLYFLYFLLIQLKVSRSSSVFGTLLFASSNILMYQASSGEVYILPMFFLLVATLRLFEYGENQNNLKLWEASLWLGTAASFHLLAVVYILVMITYLFQVHQKKDMHSLIFKICVPIGVISLFGFCVYLLPIAVLLTQFTFSDLWQTIFIYGNIFGVWNSNKVIELENIVIAFSTLSNGFASQESLFLVFGRYFFTSLGLISLVLSFRGNKEIRLISHWLLCYSFLIIFVLVIPEVFDYWLFCFIPLIVLIAFVMDKYSRGKNIFLTFLFLFFLFIGNVLTDIYPKTIFSLGDFFFADRISLKTSSPQQVIFFSKELTNEYFMRQVSIFNQKFKRIKKIYYIEDILNSKDIKIFVSALKSKKGVLLYSDLPFDELMTRLIYHFEVQVIEKESYTIQERTDVQRNSMRDDYREKPWKMYSYLILNNK